MKKAFIVILFLVLIGLFFKPTDNKEGNMEKPPVEYCEVNIKGEVLRPDVYTVPKGIMLLDVLKLSGLTKDSVYLNENSIVNKNISVLVKKRCPNPLNINTAAASELKELPGIGKATLDKITRHLSRKPFTSWLEFQEITGLSDEKILEIKARAIIR